MRTDKHRHAHRTSFLAADYLDWLQIKNMRVGDAVLDLGFSRHDQDVPVNVLRKEGNGDVAAIV